ncbi:MAG: Tex family protein [Sandaracinaceae bacterium]
MVPTPNLAPTLANELGLPVDGVRAVLALLDEGATVPFIARYRKERTGGLDEVQIRAIGERREYLIALEERRSTILASIEEQGKLTPELRRAIEACTSKSALEDLYAPYKKKRRTRATVARERGLEPLAQRILAQPRDGDPKREASAFVGPEVPTAADALAGACDIVAENVADDPRVRAAVRETFVAHGRLASRAARGKKKERSKFEQYYEFTEPVSKIPSHRVLAILRGEAEGFLRWSIEVDERRLLERLYAIAGVRRESPFAATYRDAIDDAFARLVTPSATNEIGGSLKERADREAIDVFADNLRNLLLAAPLGEAAVVGIDPGIRTGCKCAVLDATGRFLENETIYPDRHAKEAAAALVRLVRTHRARAVAVGNGTAGRETESFARSALSDAGLTDVMVVSVSESGASVYSASDVARSEFPELDLTVRGAISIGRRLQDPLAELVKVEPKAIGVGQYQHDVDQKLLAKKLDEVVESCVSAVGVALNLASAALLSRVAGLSAALANKVVAHRDKHGRFAERADLLKVSGLGPKAFEQCAGFLRIPDGAHPLDGSAVHPERYALVERMARDHGVALRALVGDATRVDALNVERYADGEVGLPTLRDIADELKRPGRDPRDSFEPPRFRDDVREIGDLEADMRLEGVVTNVTHFGAFVDLGVHQDGLIHISQLADRFVQDPREVVKVGDRVEVRVLEVDLKRKRISLSRKGL